MYSSSTGDDYKTSDYEKYSSSSAPYPPPQFSGQPTTGIPVTVSSIDQPPASWSTTLFGCCEDVPNCCITCWCPCITFGQIAEITDKGSTSCGVSGALYTLIAFVTGCPCFYSCFYRSKLRRQFRLRETPCGDCIVHLCCEGCALCQEYRELKNRGFDMSLGWHGNMEKQSQGVAMQSQGGSMAPVFQPSGMSRQE